MVRVLDISLKFSFTPRLMQVFILRKRKKSVEETDRQRAEQKETVMERKWLPHLTPS